MSGYLPYELPERTHLPARHGLTPTLTALPLDLSEVPFVLSTRRLPRVKNGEPLPLQYQRIEHEWQTPEGARHRITITGDPQLGLPHGRMDMLVLLALMELAGRQVAQDGYFEGRLHTSFREIAAAIGNDNPNKTVFKAIKDAIRRFHAIRVVGRVIREAEQLALAILSGDAAPESPTRTVMRIRSETGEHPPIIVGYRWTEEKYLVQDKEHREGYRQVLHWIDLNPKFVQQAIAGWAAWIDRKLVRQLNSDCAIRLYILLAGQAAQEVDGNPEWRFGLEFLRSSCGLTTTQKTEVRRTLARAFEELTTHSIIHDIRGSNDIYYLRPGPVLKAAHLLRGVGVLDAPDTQILVALMRRFGIDPSISRPLIAEKPRVVYRVLAYATYLEETNPKVIKKSWSGYILHAIKRNLMYENDVGFFRWLENGCRDPVRTTDPAPNSRENPAAKNPDIAYHVPAEDSIAPDLWALVRSEILEDPEISRLQMTTTMLYHMAPVRVDGDTLVLACAYELHKQWVENKISDHIERVLRAHSNGIVSRFRIEIRA